MKKIVTIIVSCAMLQLGFAQDFDKNKLNDFFNALETNNKFMGSVAVAKNGKVIYSKSVGFIDVENQKKANENSKYRIGSITKTFTSTLVLKAVEEKKLSLNQTIDAFFPTIKNANQITISQLLNHRSGIHNFTNDESYLTWNTQPKTEQEMVEIIAKAGSDFTPDSKANYSNSNYVLLSYILEKTYKKTYAEILNQNIIKPLKLANTYLGKKIDTNKNESKSYGFNGTWKAESETDISVPLGAGGIVSTPTDLTLFSEALFGGKLLKPESLELMKTIKDGYGMGLFQMPFYDIMCYGHTGGIDEFSAVFSHFPEENITYALTSNGSNYNNNNISIAVLSAIFNKPYDVPNFNGYAVSSEDLDKYLGVYASSEIPLKITISKDKDVLFAQATGQSSFPLDSVEKDKFSFDQAGIVLEFNPTQKTLILKQGGGAFTFTKE